MYLVQAKTKFLFLSLDFWLLSVMPNSLTAETGYLLFKEKHYQFQFCFSPKWLFQAHLREVSVFFFSFIFSILRLPEDLLQ